MTLDQTSGDLDACVIKAMSYQGSFLITDVDNDLVVMRECQLKATSIVHSQFARRYRESIEILCKQLKQMIKFFSLWKGLQKLWAYMSPIFLESEIASQLGEQYKIFTRTDAQYRKAVERLEGGARVTYSQFFR